MEGGLDSNLNVSPDVPSPDMRGATSRAGGGTSGNSKGRLKAMLCGNVFVVKAESSGTLED